MYWKSAYRNFYKKSGMGFKVAYLSELGKFDGLKSEISDIYESHAFDFKKGSYDETSIAYRISSTRDTKKCNLLACSLAPNVKK